MTNHTKDHQTLRNLYIASPYSFSYYRTWGAPRQHAGRQAEDGTNEHGEKTRILRIAHPVHPVRPLLCGSVMRAYGKQTSLIGPFKGINKEIKRMFSNFYLTNWVQKLRFGTFSRGSGRFRELREAGRKHFHLSWYLSVPVVTSYDQKP